jgi:hypothetical protein
MIIRSPCNKAKRTVDRGREREGGRDPFFRFQIPLFSPFFSLYDHDVSWGFAKF